MPKDGACKPNLFTPVLKVASEKGLTARENTAASVEISPKQISKRNKRIHNMSSGPLTSVTRNHGRSSQRSSNVSCQSLKEITKEAIPAKKITVLGSTGGNKSKLQLKTITEFESKKVDVLDLKVSHLEQEINKIQLKHKDEQAKLHRVIKAQDLKLEKLLNIVCKNEQQRDDKH